MREYRPTNFSAVIRAETHSFVEVTGSSATAIIGLLLYGATLVVCLYLTWSEFTEIIQRRCVFPGSKSRKVSSTLQNICHVSLQHRH